MSILLIDRDGTLIEEPTDFQVDSLSKVRFKNGVIPSLLTLKEAGFRFVMITNQDGLGTPSFPKERFQACHAFILEVLSSCGISFEQVLICPHFESDNCNCRKPKTALLDDFFQNNPKENIWVIGDRESDKNLAKNLNVSFFQINEENSWDQVAQSLLLLQRQARVLRHTKETRIELTLMIDSAQDSVISTPIPFFTHLLEQVAKHGGFYLELKATGDVDVDDHHLIEDTAIALGEGINKALGNKQGIERYGFTLPMDESYASIAMDIGGRRFCDFQGQFTREYVGQMATEMVPHFFKSFADGLCAAIHIKTQGENHHHMIEACFKVLGRALRQAMKKTGNALPSTKGCL